MKPSQQKLAPSFQASHEARLLGEVLCNVEIGEMITYEKLEEWVDRSVRNSSGRGILMTARRIAQRECDKVFEAVRGVGLKCLTDAELAALPSASIGAISRGVARTKKKVACLRDPTSLTKEEITNLNVGMAQVVAIEATTKRAARKALETRVKQEPQKSLSAHDVLNELGRRESGSRSQGHGPGTDK